MNAFETCLFQANLLYGVESDSDSLEEIGLIAWNKIGNKRTKLYRYIARVSAPDNTVDLPCNCDEIEAVTYGFEDWQYTDNLQINGDIDSNFIEHYIEGRKLFPNPYYQRGKFAKYERVGDTLYFDRNYGPVHILYKGQVLDDNGLPELTDKEVEAIACYIGYTEKFKEGWATNNSQILQMAQMLEQKWLKLCDAARVHYLNQNDMDQVLDAKSSWNRKQFGKSYKFVK